MHLLAFFSTLLVLIGIFLPWIHPSLFIVMTRGIDIRDGQVLLVFGLIASLISIYGILRGWKMLGWLYLLIGLFCAAVSGAEIYDFWRRQYNVGPGLYLTLVGGAQLALAPVLARFGQFRS
ncbi:MAG TPA: hypothetical protein VFG95_09755 [Nitrospiria bacterium]|nr:hypothetical protein [Nitrospiria bacterium]